ncbi:hypothetical protein A2U01_0102447, partial [Trifolium medium]|nr:hypothetical protein [Trifolium medium]
VMAQRALADAMELMANEQ